MVDAWNRRQWTLFLESFHDDAVWHALPGNPDYPDPVHGREAIREILREWLEPWDRYELETLELTEHGEAVVWTARHIASQDRTGMKLEVSMSGVFGFRDGRIVEARFFREKADAREAAAELRV
jgi:ketosteroid isomerase-like protein